MTSPEQIVEQLFNLLAKGAKKPFFGKPRYPLEPALQAAYAAWASGAGDELILAALLEGVEPRLREGKLPPLADLGFSPRVCQLAGDAGALAALRQFPLDPGQPVPGLESYRALAIDHVATSSKGR